MKANEILLVGGTGYIGTVLYQKLKQNYGVCVTGREKKTEFGKNFKYLSFSDRVSIKRVLGHERYDLVIVLAAQKRIQVIDEIDFGSNLFKDNVFGLNAFFRHLFKLQDGAKIIFVSSMTVYDPLATSPVSEESGLKPIHDYGFSKVLGEKIFTYYVSHHEVRGVIVRIPGVFGGPRKSGYIFNLINKMMNNEPVEVNSAGLGYWETINIDDLADMLVEFVAKYSWPRELATFNLGYGEETDFIKTAYLLRSLLNSKSNIRVGRKDYRRFFLDNGKISRYVDMKNYSYLQALKRYIGEVR